MLTLTPLGVRSRKASQEAVSLERSFQNPDLLFVSDIPMTIYVGNLSYQATVDDLKSVFAEYGAVKRVVLPTDRETGRMRGFAFVEMEQDAQEDAAITELDGAEWMGRQLRVNKAKPKGE